MCIQTWNLSHISLIPFKLSNSPRGFVPIPEKKKKIIIDNEIDDFFFKKKKQNRKEV